MSTTHMSGRPRCGSVGRVTARLLLSFLVLSPVTIARSNSWWNQQAPVPEPGLVLPGQPSKPESRDHEFTLRHVFHHGTYKHPGLHRRLDVEPETEVWIKDEEEDTVRKPVPKLAARSAPLTVKRLKDRSRDTIESIMETGRMRGQAVDLPLAAWTDDEVSGPDVTHKPTVLSFARMAADAYVTGPDGNDWLPVEGGFNYTEDFGWEKDGLRGHIFADTENRTVIIGLKGTSPALFDGSETTTNDKINDNLFFSCCCGQGGQFMWKQVCDCMTSTYQCNSTCLVTALRKKNHYYYAAQHLYHNVTALYPDAEVWLAGHSLGGSVSSMLGLTYGVPAITFEAVPEAMPAARLGLPIPPGDSIGSMAGRAGTGGFHFGHTADPVYMGACNTATSVCTIGGYAMQSVCHTGHKCVYDTVKDKGWRMGIGTHKINGVIKDVIEAYKEIPQCVQYTNCTDCYNWEYYESNGTSSTTTSLSTSTTTSKHKSTSTCKTPGWWGCLDEDPITTTESTTSTTSSSSEVTTTTETCKTPGWFGGCNDDAATTSTSSSTSATPAPVITTTSSTPTASTSCSHHGWFGGCKDLTSTTTELPTAPVTSSAPKPTCTSKKWLGLKCADAVMDQERMDL